MLTYINRLYLTAKMELIRILLILMTLAKYPVPITLFPLVAKKISVPSLLEGNSNNSFV